MIIYQKLAWKKHCKFSREKRDLEMRWQLTRKRYWIWGMFKPSETQNRIGSNFEIMFNKWKKLKTLY